MEQVELISGVRLAIDELIVTLIISSYIHFDLFIFY